MHIKRLCRPPVQRMMGLATLAIGLTISPLAQAQEKTNDDIVTSYTLDNGMQVVVIPDHRAPIATHMVWYKTGAADEAAGKSGIAHFFEHLMFKGTKDAPAGKFSKAVSQIGGQENAFTSYDYTAYYQKVAPSALETMMGFEADRMRNLDLSEDVIGSERKVILEERNSRIEGSPGALLAEEIDATLFQNHPYGIPVIGWKHEMEQLNREDAIEFYNQYYAPNNAILVVAGDVEPDQVLEMAQRTYGKVKSGPKLEPRVRPQEPEQNTQRTVTLKDARVTQPSVQTTWLVPSNHTSKNLEAESLDLLAQILGQGTLSRFYQELIVKQGIASSVGAYYMAGALDDGQFVIYGAPLKETPLEDLEAALNSQLQKIIDEGVSDEELKRAQKSSIASAVYERDDQTRMANTYGAGLTTGLTVEQINTWPDRIREVKSDDIQAVAKKYLSQSHNVTGYLLPLDSQEKSTIDPKAEN